jgi:hypothetical protein
MDIRWAAPPLAKQVSLYIAYAGSAETCATIDANKEGCMHQVGLFMIAAQTADNNKSKMARISPYAHHCDPDTRTQSALKIR